MQRFYFIILTIVLALSGGSIAATAASSEELPRQQEHTPQPVYEPERVPHVALLLPLESPAFGSAAEVVKEGFIAATQREQALPLIIRLYSTTDDPLDIFSTYHEAISAGAVFIVGPLTRDGVSAIASSNHLKVPTLALNAVNSSMDLPSNLYLFGLQMETEATQIAQLALLENRTHATVISDHSPLSKRLQTAFSEKWLTKYGHTADSIQYAEDPSILQQLRPLTTGSHHLIFLALDAAKTRIIRSYLDPDVPVYATSQVYIGTSDFLFNNDLNGIRFMDMPWLLQPDHPAVMAYRHPDQIRSMDMERLYALGIDAFRLMTYLLRPQPVHQISFDGVTGFIRFMPPNQFVREPVAAQFTQGKVQLIEPSKENQDTQDTPEYEGQ